MSEPIRTTWGTPRGLFSILHSQYRFTVDACASAWNAKLDRYWTREDDGLAQPWAGEHVWCNPPYSDIEPWICRAYECQRVASTALLLPVRTDTDWWLTWALRATEQHWFRGRLRFEPPPGVEPSSSIERHVLLLYYGAPSWRPIQRVRCGRTGELLGEVTA